MKHAAWLTVVLAAVVCGLGHFADFAADDGEAAAAAPPLTLSPELLSEGLPTGEKKEALEVDNSACYVCHGNYDGEELVVVHGKEGTGCMDCHGLSIDHRNDEDNITPPDKMFALEDVDAMCGECHDMHEAPARDVIQRWQERCPEKTDPDKIVCTDCHFHHRLAFRTVSWDKKTGKLIICNEAASEPPAASVPEKTAAQTSGK